MSFLGEYLTRLREIRSMGLATAETSYYAPLEYLLNAVGNRLIPQVAVAAQLSMKGQAVAPRGAEVRGFPDFGFFVVENQDLRGLIEAKAPDEIVEEIARRPQIAKYLRAVPGVLVTNYRAFAFVTRDARGAPQLGPSYILAPDAQSFWQLPVTTIVTAHERGLRDYLEAVFQYSSPITTPHELALILARYAAEARQRLDAAPYGALDPLRLAMTESLGIGFPGAEGEAFFRSSLIQTLFYGLFSAWTIWAEQSPIDADPFVWEEASNYLHVAVVGALFEAIATNRRLRSLQLADPVRWAEAALNRVQRDAFFRHFAQESAIQYFYEPFLAAYDPLLRDQLGVWYTPPEIVHYQMARIDQLLQQELGIEDGLADDSVVILDPCTGTASYLLEAARIIHKRLAASDPGLAAARTATAIRTRLYGFEILPAPFVVAHLQMGRLAASFGSPLVADQRAAIFLANALLNWSAADKPEQTSFPELAEERRAAERVKRTAPILVVVGNPPYRRYAPITVGEEAQLLAPYKHQLYQRFKVRKTTIDDYYIRFYRLAEWRIAEQSPYRGIVSLISNRSWLTGRSFPVMREHLLHSFDRVYIDDLGGGYRGRDRRIREADESVFSTQANPGITPNVAISFLVACGRQARTAPAHLMYRRLRGRAEEKRAALLASVEQPQSNGSGDADSTYTKLQPTLAKKWVIRSASEAAAYDRWVSLAELLPHWEMGVNENRGGSLISIDPAPLHDLRDAYMAARLSHQQLAERSPRAALLMRGWARYEPTRVRDVLLRAAAAEAPRVVRFAFKPFDDRWLIWGGNKLLNEKRSRLFAQVDDLTVPPEERNVFLVTCEASREVADPPGVTTYLGDMHYLDPWAHYFPLRYRVAEAGYVEAHTRPNLAPAILAAWSAEWGVTLTPQLETASPDELAIGEAAFYHVLATLYTPSYRDAFADELASNWARIPLPKSREILLQSAALGRRVAELLRTDLRPSGVLHDTIPDWLQHIAQARRADDSPLRDPQDFDVTVNYRGAGQVREHAGNRALSEARSGGGPDLGTAYDIFWNGDAYWSNMPANVWEWQIGNFPVLRKWLEDRQRNKLGRPLTIEEVQEFSSIARRIAALLQLGDDLDACHESVINAELLEA